MDKTLYIISLVKSENVHGVQSSILYIKYASTFSPIHQAPTSHFVATSNFSIFAIQNSPACICYRANAIMCNECSHI